MGRPRPRLLNPTAAGTVLLLPLLLLLAAAGAAEAQRVAEDPDPTDDVTSKPGVTVDEPTVDLVTFTVERDGDVLVLRNEVSGALPLPGTAEPDGTRLYTFLFVVDLQSSRDQPLIQSADVVVVCTFHHGTADLSCDQSQGDRTLLGVGTSGRNVTVRVALDAGEDVEPVLGGGAVTLKDEPSGDILAQDWTPSTIAGQDAVEPDDGGEDGADGEEDGTPWSRRPLTAVAVALLLVGLSFLAYRRFRDRP